ncbi:single-stranded-DNA-specific exonuclease RecJ [Edaphobacillus lindanitolerans]|uniref:Single-stranded-DNA-specific exonuclease RecJ n=1 Tax=Edaphobacillus lindanitolerans TaxID=550447 RepID=A0A1U7PPN0_9BACI|nr:single-stranded-DNA-specific exonuclease RecJ [Edaphobacillus lindanitolerans]SIT82853.1 single-stranded-DNA-specific exonuclease [Edaphobacillus lindanitolerans]
MIDSKKRWRTPETDARAVQALTDSLGLSPIAAKVLAARGFTEPEAAEAFINMDLSSWHDPFGMKDMDIAVGLIQQHIRQGSRIAVYGDYDADGVTSTSVMMKALLSLGADAFYAIPNRFRHGYGPNTELFTEVYEKGASLIVTVDNGISGVEQIKAAKALGMDVIVTDHHEPGEILPDADAIIHPRHPDGDYPFGDLAGVGVALKVAHALTGDFPADSVYLGAIGTVADLVPLHGENRLIVKMGIDRLRHSAEPAVKALCKVADVQQPNIDEETIGFGFGPRINALGRLGDADPAVRMFLTEDPAEAGMLASTLDDRNRERQKMVASIADEAIAWVEDTYGDALPAVLTVAGEGWNPGVVGIVASKLTERYYRPSLVLSLDPEKGIAKGSARSIEGFHLYKELAKNAELIPHFGGHPMAAGLTLPIVNVGQLRDNLIRQGEETLSDEDLIPVIDIDVRLALDEVDLASIESLRALSPFGSGFAKPVYGLSDLSVESSRKIGSMRNHLKLTVTDGRSQLDVVGFGLGHIDDELTPDAKVSLAGDLQINEWNGRKKPQLLLKDLKSSGWQLFDVRGERVLSRWLPAIPEDALFVAFKKENADKFRADTGKEILLTSQVQPERASSLVILDLPDNMGELEGLLGSCSPSRVYTHFHVPESRYFMGMPDRKQFGWYYTFLKQKGTFHVMREVDGLAKHRGWSRDTIIFMTKVFFELGFVTMENGFAVAVGNPPKRDLSESGSYRGMERQIEIEQALLYSPYMELRRVIGAILDAPDTAREEQQLWI